MRQYVLAGGNLIVLGVGDDFAGLPALDELLAMPSGGTVPADVAAPLWQAPRAQRYGVELTDLITPSGTAL